MRTIPSPILAVLVALISVTSSLAQEKKEERTIENGSVVKFEYTLSDEKGKLIESSKDKEPMTYTHGEGQIIPGLEKELTGMKVGAEKHVEVKPEEAYGPFNPKAFQEVPKSNLPAEALKVGAVLVARSPHGENFPVRVHEIKDETVVLDLNHPLAGKTLAFDVKIVSIEAPEKK